MASVVESVSNLSEGETSLSLGWKENPAAKRLLDALVSILVEEYIQTAKANPEIFSE